MQAKVITNFVRLNESDFQTKVALIVASLTGNARFPEPWPAPAPSLAQINAAFDVYRSAYRASLTHDTLKIAERNSAREALSGLLQTLVKYLEFVANDNESALQSTGFDLRRDAVRGDHAETLVAPEGLKLKRGVLGGQVDVRVNRLLGAGSYEAEIAQGDPNVEDNWHHALTSTSSMHMLLRDLPAAQTFWVRVRGINTAGAGLWSEPASIMVV
ncbi:MAG: fibronectin type III domain-containing protein [Leptothrix ochracea]|uniref:fibronectin type III domain-containing protein n=1 Tax=Leptothrix ochracea TaxID=735331 RepID=UPI0034E214A7